ncbi:MAG: peptidylprolyl isomerase [Saprospiraceae bacterium]|nr:peptidylprolyl isomerase [Saprospiraceae bacterium]
MKKNNTIFCIIIVLIFFSITACVTTSTTTNSSNSDTNSTYYNNNGRQTIVRKAGNVVEVEPTKIILEPDPYSALVEIETKFGIMKIELFFDAQKHRENFLKLSNQGYYDSLMFHRVIKNFMAQSGDPNSRNAQKGQRLGGGGPPHKIDSEFGQNYFHIKGALAAARQPDEMNPDKKSSGSQFYIVQGSSVSPIQLDKNERNHDIVYTEEQRQLYYKLGGSPQLDMEYTVFGRVYEGLELIDSICYKTTDAYARPIDDIRLKVRVVRD